MKNLNFRHFVANADFGKLNVSVYNPADADDVRILIVESATEENPDIPAITISADEYAALRDEWTEDGALPDGDVRITARALEFCDTFNHEKSGYHGNKNAQRDPDESASSILTVRCKPSDKALWVKAAKQQPNNKKLSDWAIKTLNNATREQLL